MVRRARRQTASQLARGKARIEQRLAEQTRRIYNKKIARGIQEFAIRSMNELARRGPAWSGEFSASWGFVPEGMTPNTAGTTGRVYKYTKNDLPINYVERYINDGYTRFSIMNTSDHAAEAIDQTQAVFRHPGYDAIKERELGDGRNQPSFRYDIGGAYQGDNPGEAPASRTAEPDWYITYLLGGALQNDLEKGFSVVFQSSF